MSAVSFQSGAVTQPCDLLGCAAQFPPRNGRGGNGMGGASSGTSFSSLSGGVADSVAGGGAIDLQQLIPARGRLGIEEIPFQGQDPTPQVVVPPPLNGWGAQAVREDALQRFENRSTQGLDGGGRSTDITRFTPQLIQYQQPDDMSRIMSFERNSPAAVKTTQRQFV
jgi:hypothetical protein